MSTIRTKVETGIYVRTLKDGTTRYDVALTDSRGKLYWESAHSKREAKNIRAARQAAKAEGRGAVHSTLTFAELFDEYGKHLDALVTNGKLRPNSVASQKANITKHVIPVLGTARLSKLTTRHAHELVDALRAGKLADSTSRLVLDMTGRVLQFGKRRGWVTINVIRELERDERPSSKTNRQALPLEAGELHKLLASAASTWRLVFLTAALTGLRQSELLGLTWGDIDWASHVIRVRQQLGRDGVLHPTKTEAGRRDVVLSPTLQRELRVAFMASRDKSAKGLIFVTAERKPRNHRVALDVFQTACRKADIEGRVFHDLRHTFASSLIAAGVDVVFVSRQLGHASPAVTLSVYAHVYDKARRVEQATAALEAVMVG